MNPAPRSETMTDLEQLQRYVRTGANDAFAAVVAQHAGWVFGAALRQTGSSALAEEVAQAVFLDLAQRAAKLRADTQLGSWLCVVTRRTAVDVLRRESRRQQRERVAVDLAAMNTDNHDWRRAEPVIDEALATLHERDRRAVLLRFFEQRSFAEIGQALGLTDDAAQKSVSRALDRLRDFLRRRGIATTAAALGAGLSASAQLAAPAGLAATICTTVTATVAAAAAATASASLFAKLTMAASNKLLLGTTVALAVGGIVVGAGVIETQRTEIARLRRELYTPPPGIVAPASNPGAGAPAAAAANPIDPIGARLDELGQRVALLKRMLASMPNQRIPELENLTEQDWLDVAIEREPRTAEDFRRAFGTLRNRARFNTFQPVFQRLRDFLAARQGDIPTSLAELTHLATTPLERAMLARCDLVARGNVTQLAANADILVENRSTIIDPEHDGTIACGWSHLGPRQPPTPARDQREVVRRMNNAADFAAAAFARAHAGRKPATVEEILPYFRDPNDAADFKYAFEQMRNPPK